jgi:hypothetical protein
MIKKGRFCSQILLSFVVVMLFIGTSYGDIIQLSINPINSQVLTNPAIIGFNGKLYTENIWLEDVSSGKMQAEYDETFIANVLAANQSGTAADVLATWNPSERSQMSVYINNPNLFTANKNWNNNVKNSALLAKIYFGNFTIFAVQHTMKDTTVTVKMYSIISANGSNYMTNLLSSDPMYLNYMIKVKNLVAVKVKQ